MFQSHAADCPDARHLTHGRRGFAALGVADMYEIKQIRPTSSRLCVDYWLPADRRDAQPIDAGYVTGATRLSAVFSACCAALSAAAFAYICLFLYFTPGQRLRLAVLKTPMRCRRIPAMGMTPLSD